MLELMRLVRWSACFIVSPHTKKGISPIKVYPLSGDRVSNPETEINKESFDAIAKKYENSGNNISVKDV